MATQLARIERRLGIPSLTGRGRILVAVTTDTFGVGLFLPISLLYFVIVSPFAAERLGFLLSLATFASLPMGIVAGELVQRFGPKRLLVANNLCSATGYLCYLLVGVWPRQPLIFAGMLLVAFADRMFWSCWLPYVKQLSTEGDDFDSWFSFIEGIKAACMLAGAGLAALLLAAGDRRQVSILVSLNIVTCLVSAVLIGRDPIGAAGYTPAADRSRQVGWGAVLRDRRFSLAALGQFLSTPIGLLGVIAFPVFYVRDWHLGAWVAPTMYAVGNLMTFAGQSAMTEVMRALRRPLRLVLACGFGAAAMALLVASSTPAPGPAAGASIALTVTTLLGISGLIFFPAVNAAVMDMATERNSGRVVGLFHTGTSAGVALAPALMTGLLAHPASLWWVMALMYAAGTAAFHLAIRTDLRSKT